MWVEIVWISFWVSKIFAKLLPYLFKFFVGFVSAGTAKYSTIIAALEVPFALLAWSFVSFVTFIPIMTRNPTERASGDTDVRGWEATLRQILAALTVIALVYLIQKTFIQFVAINFHKVSYEQRIQKNKHSVHILARLYEQSRALFPQFSQDFKHDDEVLMGVGGETKLGYRSVSGTATPTMRAVLGGAKKAVNKATSAFGSVAQEVTGKQIFQPTSPYSVVVEALASSSSCTSLARRLWFSFTVEGEEVLHQQDLEEVLGNAEEAREAMQLFDKVCSLPYPTDDRTGTEMSLWTKQRWWSMRLARSENLLHGRCEMSTQLLKSSIMSLSSSFSSLLYLSSSPSSTVTSTRPLRQPVQYFSLYPSSSRQRARRCFRQSYFFFIRYPLAGTFSK